MGVHSSLRSASQAISIFFEFSPLKRSALVKYALSGMIRTLVAFGVLAVVIPVTGYTAPIEKVSPTVSWHSGCDGQSYATPEAALASFTQCSTTCATYSGTGIQVSPNEYHAQVTVYQTCPPPSNPTTYYTTGTVGTGSCSTPYAGDPSQFYNSPGYIYAPPTTGYPFGYCYIYLIQTDQTQKPCDDNCVGNPILPGIGNKRQEDVDYVGQGTVPLTLSRIYNSAAQFGRTWNTNWNRSVTYAAAGGTQKATINRPDGSYTFTRSGSVWVPDSDVNYKLTGNDQGFIVTTPDGQEQETYDAYNQLSMVATAGGVPKYTLTYSGSSPRLLMQVRDEFGHSLNFTYDAQNRLATATDPGGGLHQYGYDANSNLTSVTYPDGKIRQYVYNELAYTAGVNQPNLLTGIVDENNARFANFGYSAAGLAALSEHAGGADHYAVSYTTPPMVISTVTLDSVNHIKYLTTSYQAPTGVAVTDGLGVTRHYGSTTINGRVKTTGSDQPCTGPCTPVPQAQTFDANGNVDSKTDFNGNLTTYVFDLARNLETSRTEASGTTLSRTITTSWHATFRLPSLITEPNRTTGYTYNSAGNVLTKTVTDTSVVPNVVRTWTYTYNGHGRVLTENGPRTDVSDITTYTYYTCTTGYQCGQLNTVANAASQVTTYNTYNAHGQPLTITDPNGVVTTLTYDARQRLTSRQIGTETTTFDYWPTGLLKKVTLPDSSYLQYTYDNAHRLARIDDGAGNHIQYMLDAMGNRTAESVYDPTSFLTRTRTQVFNSLNQLWKELGAAGTPAVTTEFLYDANGNQTNINAPLSRNTVNAYDELNRLKQITDPASGVTQFGYDANDNLTSVTDPRSLATTYTYTGFGDLKTQVSPDTGTTTNTYDSGGNLKTSKDARNKTGTYSYDALNRVTQVAYGDQTISYTYDAGTNGKGHLTGASDSSHTLAWAYDAQGRVTGKGQTTGTVTKSVGYGYTNGRLTSMTMPSGQLITYGYNSNHQIVSLTIGSTTVLNNVLYEPFGPIAGWTWGNGTLAVRTYDTDGKLTQIDSAGLKTFSYDDAFRITGVTDTVVPANSWTYGYDPLDRLTSAIKTGTTRGWTYDANGNRLTETGTSPSTYAIAGTNNRLSSITGAVARTYTYDAAGNALTFAGKTATFNNRGRLKTMNNGSTTATYVYDALGQLIKQSGGTSGTKIYMYDEAGHFLGEYGSGGALVREMVWFGDIPVAALTPKTGGVDIWYIHTDQINTPRIITRPSDNKQRWRWDAEPFGTGADNTNPEGLGNYIFNVRFAGQVADSQAGLRQNYMRDFDPVTGRYIESDPVGLHGGINTYLYAMGNPLSNVDPFGLETQPGSGKPKSYPNCMKWPGFPGKDCNCAEKCSMEVIKFTRGCIKDCRWRYVIVPGGQALLTGFCSEASREWGRQCLESCQ